MPTEQSSDQRTPNGHPYFRVPEIYTQLDPDDLAWPRDRGFASGNRQYQDVTATWVEVDKVLATEGSLIEELSARHPASPLVDLFDVIDKEAYTRLGWPFDFGVCAATLALNAAGCPTATSCAGHFEGYPIVVFWTRPRWTGLLVDAAIAARVGIGNAHEGTVEIFTQPEDVLGFVRFARELRKHADEFSVIGREPRPAGPSASVVAKAAKKKRKDQKRARKRSKHGR
jgi:hypothetical protein